MAVPTPSSAAATSQGCSPCRLTVAATRPILQIVLSRRCEAAQLHNARAGQVPGSGFGMLVHIEHCAVGLVVRIAEAVQAGVFIGVFPPGLQQLGVRPSQTMPAWLEPFAANQPVTVATNALRGLILGQGALPPGHTVAGQVALVLLWSAAIIAVFAPLAVRIYRRSVRHPRASQALRLGGRSRGWSHGSPGQPGDAQ